MLSILIKECCFFFKVFLKYVCVVVAQKKQLHTLIMHSLYFSAFHAQKSEAKIVLFLLAHKHNKCALKLA
jgi:hypothetical protein